MAQAARMARAFGSAAVSLGARRIMQASRRGLYNQDPIPSFVRRDYRRPVNRSRTGASMTYRKPPRVKLAKQRKRLTKNERKKLNRYYVKFPHAASIKVILGNQTPNTDASTPLGPQWTRATGINATTLQATSGASETAVTGLCGFVVRLTSDKGVRVGQGAFAADTSGPSAGNYNSNNLLWTIKPDSSGMVGEAHNYQCSGLRAMTDANYLVSGIKGSFRIGGMQQSCDQKVYIQIVRRFDKPSTIGSIEVSDFKELVNAQSLPNNQHFVQLYRKSFIIKGRGSGSARIPTHSVNFDLPLNYMRSKTKKISTAASATNYGTQLDYAYENSEEMYNTLYLVITSRSLNTLAQEATDTRPDTAVSGSYVTHPSTGDGGGRMAPRIGIQGHVTTMYRYRNMRQAPGATTGSPPSEEED